MPMASDGKRLFPVTQTNSYGRIMLARQMEIHDELLVKAPVLIDDKMSPIYLRQMQVLRKAERWKPSYNQMKRRQDDDIVMTNLIRDAQCTCSNQLDGHILRFRERHPNYIPGFLKKYEDMKSMEVHDEVIRKSKKWIDDAPPVLKKTPFTRGGFPRVASMSPGKKRKGKKRASPLPARRGSGGGKAWQRRRSSSSSPVQQRTVATADQARQGQRELEQNHDAQPASPSPPNNEAGVKQPAVSPPGIGSPDGPEDAGDKQPKSTAAGKAGKRGAFLTPPARPTDSPEPAFAATDNLEHMVDEEFLKAASATQQDAADEYDDEWESDLEESKGAKGDDEDLYDDDFEQ